MEIGDYCLITEGVVILAHDYSFAVLVNAYHDISRKQRITHIGNNVFIGMNSIILMGAQIGDNVIIGAGSVVSGQVDSNSIYAGNPAKKICTLEEYHKSRQGDFLNRAVIYASKTKDPPKMGLYRILFEEDENFQGYISGQSFHGISSEALNSLVKPTDNYKWEDISKMSDHSK